MALTRNRPLTVEQILILRVLADGGNVITYEEGKWQSVRTKTGESIDLHGRTLEGLMLRDVLKLTGKPIKGVEVWSISSGGKEALRQS